MMEALGYAFGQQRRSCVVSHPPWTLLSSCSMADDYRSHTTCITEKERYEGKKPKVKASPQDAWMDLIAGSVDQAPGRLKPHLSAMVSLANVPRKAKAFRNFTANSLNLRGKQGEAIVTELWDFLQKVRNEHKETNEETKCDSTNNNNKNKGPPQQPSSSSETAIERNDVAAPEELNKSTNVSTDDQSPNVSTDDNVKAKKTSVLKTDVDKKTVKKAMKRILKKHKSLTVKVLRKEVRVKLGDMSKSRIKELVQAELGDKDLFRVDGRIIQLKASG